MHNANSLKVLMELRPALEGYAGIPQETRLLFSTLCKLDNVKITGLLNHSSRELSPAQRPEKAYHEENIHKKYHLTSSYIISHLQPDARNIIDRLIARLKRTIQLYRLFAQSTFGVQQKIYSLDLKHFEDFLWNSVFSKSLTLDDFDIVAQANYCSIMPAWDHMHKLGRFPVFGYPKIATKDFDMFIAQTPWPSRLAQNTQLVVRYHDAIPVFMPHTIINPVFHHFAHYNALKLNVKSGSIFVCNSEHTRQELLTLFPRIEDRTAVISPVLSKSFYPEDTTRSHLGEIIENRISRDTEPDISPRRPMQLWRRKVDEETLRYLIVVSTIEPRKNHRLVISAWEALRQQLDLDLKLVLVGAPGWDNEQFRRAMSSWQMRAELFHLTDVPAADLRRLYGGAEAVICASVAEGFDLSGIEAMLCGVPVVASDIPAHREVYGNASEYFNPYSTMQCTKAIEAVISPDAGGRREDLIKLGFKRAAQFGAENVALKWQSFFDRYNAGEFRKAVVKPYPAASGFAGDTKRVLSPQQRAVPRASKKR